MKAGFVMIPNDLNPNFIELSPEAVKVFMYLCTRAAYSLQVVNGIDINIGGVLTSRQKLAEIMKFDKNSLRKVLNKLEKLDMIRMEATPRHTLIYITHLEEQPEKLKLEQPKPKPKKEPTARKPKFVPPTLEEIQHYVTLNRINVNPEAFFLSKESDGWKRKNKYVDWEKDLRFWEVSGWGKPNNTGGKTFKQIDRDEQDRKNYEATERLRESIHKGIARAIATNGADDEFPF